MAGWSAEAWSLVVSGGMLALVVITSFHPRVALSNGSRIVFLAGAVVFVAFALVSEVVLDATIPPFVFVLPLVPIAIGAEIALDVMADRRARRGPALGSGRGPEFDGGPTPQAAPIPFHAEGSGADRMLAASPYATASELSDLAYTRPELRPAIAANPSAPASLLQWLTEQGEPAVLAAISSRRPLAG